GTWNEGGQNGTEEERWHAGTRPARRSGGTGRGELLYQPSVPARGWTCQVQFQVLPGLTRWDGTRKTPGACHDGPDPRSERHPRIRWCRSGTRRGPQHLVEPGTWHAHGHGCRDAAGLGPP